MHRTYELSMLLLIEGISVPLSKAQITFGINRPAIGVFDLVPLKEINDIKPRTLCQFFVRNYMGPVDEYVLAYEGEVFAYNFGCHAAGNRRFQLRCMDSTNYLDYASLYFADARKGLTGTAAAGTTALEEGKTVNTTIISTATTVKSTVASKVLGLYKETNGDIGLMIGKLAATTVDINAFFHANCARLQVFDRIASTSAGDLQKLFEFPLYESLLEEQIGSMGQFQTMRDIIQLYMGMIFHEMVTIPFPIMKDKKLQQFVVKPEAYMLAPPRCNVVFPNQYVDMNVERNFMAEITRARMAVPPPLTMMDNGALRLVDKVYAAPAFYEEMLSINPTFSNSYLRGTPDISTTTGVTGVKVGDKSKDPAKPTVRECNNYSKEEVMKGIILPPPIYPTNAVNYMVATAKDKKETETDRMFQNSLYYEYYKGRYAARRSSVTGRLNFAVVPGFNVLFIDSTDAGQNIVGMLESVTHTFGTTFGSHTLYDIAYARNVDEKQTAGDNSFADAPIPPWFTEDVFGKTSSAEDTISKVKGSNGEKIREELGGTLTGVINDFGTRLDNYYTGFLGIKSLTNEANKTIPEASRFYSAGYDAVDDKEAFIRDVIQRPYATMAEVMDNMGAKQVSYSAVGNVVSTEYTGGLLETYPTVTSEEWPKVSTLFNDALKSRRKVIKAYAKRLKTHASFGGTA